MYLIYIYSNYHIMSLKFHKLMYKFRENNVTIYTFRIYLYTDNYVCSKDAKFAGRAKAQLDTISAFLNSPRKFHV